MLCWMRDRGASAPLRMRAMPQTTPEIPTPEPLWRYLFRAFVHAHRRRPVSFYLLVAIFIVCLLGVQFVYAANDPKKLAFFLTLTFIFCFVVMYRALADAVDILRAHRQAKRDLYESTLGDKYFTHELGDRVGKQREAAGGRLDWPE